jgi:hypothetical protein
MNIIFSCPFCGKSNFEQETDICKHESCKKSYAKMETNMDYNLDLVIQDKEDETKIHTAFCFKRHLQIQFVTESDMKAKLLNIQMEEVELQFFYRKDDKLGVLGINFPNLTKVTTIDPKVPSTSTYGCQNTDIPVEERSNVKEVQEGFSPKSQEKIETEKSNLNNPMTNPKGPQKRKIDAKIVEATVEKLTKKPKSSPIG